MTMTQKIARRTRWAPSPRWGEGADRVRDKSVDHLEGITLMPEAFICDGMRTPIGRYGGALAKVRTDDLAAVPIKALMQRHPTVDWSRLDEVYFGCANQAGEDNRNVARMAL